MALSVVKEPPNSWCILYFIIQDVMHNEDVARLVLQAAGRCFLTSARELCAEAMILGSTDNVTALVIDLR